MPQPANPATENTYPHPPEDLPYEAWHRLMMDFFRQGGDIARKWQRNLTPSRKADKSVITEADLEVSALAHRVFAPLKEQGHLILDEETADTTGAPADLLEPHDFIWAIDPIDGTSSYAMGLPSYAISLGLIYKGQPLMGGVYMPATDTLFIHDEQQPLIMQRPFGTSVHTETMRLMKTTKGHVFFDVISGKAIKKYNLKTLPADITASNAMAVGLANVAAGRLMGCYFKAAVWDLAGAWPLLKDEGAGIFNLNTGEPLEAIRPDMLTEGWYFKDPYIACNPDFFKDIQKAFKPLK